MSVDRERRRKSLLWMGITFGVILLISVWVGTETFCSDAKGELTLTREVIIASLATAMICSCAALACMIVFLLPLKKQEKSSSDADQNDVVGEWF